MDPITLAMILGALAGAGKTALNKDTRSDPMAYITNAGTGAAMGAAGGAAFGGMGAAGAGADMAGAAGADMPPTLLSNVLSPSGMADLGGAAAGSTGGDMGAAMGGAMGGMSVGMPDAGLDPSGASKQVSPLNKLLQNALGSIGKGKGTQKEATPPIMDTPLSQPNMSNVQLQTPYYAPPNPINPLPPLYGMGGKYGGRM